MGYILGVWPFMGSMTIVVCGILSHTWYPVTWFQVLVFACLILIWLQHIFLQVCVFFIAERKLTSKEPPFYEIIRDVLHVEPENFTLHFLVAETVAVGCFSLELISKLSVFLYEYYGVEI